MTRKRNAYAAAGVDVDLGNKLKRRIHSLVKQTHGPGVLGKIGGETAQLPDMYRKGEYDLAGCIVGVVDRAKMIDGRKIKPGDVILGLSSNGLHTNGYSLARKILFEKMKLKPGSRLPGPPFG